MQEKNPFQLTPAEGEYFVGREDVLADWRERLTEGSEAWKAGKSWLILAAGGMGKSSLLEKLKVVARDEFQAHVIHVDFGLYRDLQNPEGFFSALETPIAAAPDAGTRIRSVVGLSPNTSLRDFNYQSAVERISITIGPISLALSSPDKKSDRLHDFVNRLDGIFLQLRGIAERLGQPIVVLIDQLGKAHDNTQWVMIARLLLEGIFQLRKDNLTNIAFVLAMRPERYTLLETHIRRSDLFSDFVFVRKHMPSFDEGDARKAIRLIGCGLNKARF